MLIIFDKSTTYPPEQISKTKRLFLEAVSESVLRLTHKQPVRFDPRHGAMQSSRGSRGSRAMTKHVFHCTDASRRCPHSLEPPPHTRLAKRKDRRLGKILEGVASLRCSLSEFQRSQGIDNIIACNCLVLICYPLG